MRILFITTVLLAHICVAENVMPSTKEPHSDHDSGWWPTQAIPKALVRTTNQSGFEMMVQQVPEYLAFFGYEALARTVQADAMSIRDLFDSP